jgi:hypothetical protein
MTAHEKLTDAQLADRLLQVVKKVSAYPPAVRADLLTEAARRLTSEHLELVKFQETIRDRMIEEANKRGWCSEFDGIIAQYGLAPRWANFRVTTKHGPHIQATTLLARDAEHARQLVSGRHRRTVGTIPAITKVEMSAMYSRQTSGEPQWVVVEQEETK